LGIETLKRLASPEYLVVTEPGPLGSLWLLYLALGLFFGAGLVAALWVLLGPGRREHSLAQRSWAWFELSTCLAGLATVVGRALRFPGWSARIWPYTLAALAVAATLAYRYRGLGLPAWLEDQLRVLALRPGPQSRDRDGSIGRQAAWLLLGLAVHLAGVAFVLVERYRWPLWAAPLVLLLLLAPQAPLLARRQGPRLMALTPLFGAYAAVALWTLYRQAGITVIGWQGLAFPNPMTSFFYADAIVLASVAWVMLCHLGILALGSVIASAAKHHHEDSRWQSPPMPNNRFLPSRWGLHRRSAPRYDTLHDETLSNRAILWRVTAIALLAITLTWAGVVYLGKRTHGATASDPYAYAQMGVDLAERGTFLHRLSLFEEVMPLGIAWAPLQPVGYHIPRNELGDSPSVWATGASVLLALGYRILGEPGLYVTTPIVALLALGATWALVQEALRGRARSTRYLTGALAVTLTATSTEHVDRLLVPMADASAQLFTALTLTFALRGMHQLQDQGRSIWSFLLAGFCTAWAYWTRHTQIVLTLPVVLAALLGIQPAQPNRARSRRPSVALLSLLIFFGAALLAALPDIVYRWRHFGGPFATETTELPLMALQHIGPVGWQMLRDALVAGEWGYLFPLAVYGGYRLARDRRREAIVLGSALLAVLVVHLTYRSLRLRDLISLFPLVNLAVGYGAVTLARWARGLLPGPARRARLGRALLPAGAIGWIILSLALSRWAMVDNAWRPGWASFGYMRAEQRAAFDRLAELTPPEAIIGASLNAGAIMMYTGRDAIRPYDSWTGEEWGVFLRAMQARRRPVYLLDDGELMAEFIDRDRGRHRLTPIEGLEVPLFYSRDRDTGWLYRLEWGR